MVIKNTNSVYPLSEEIEVETEGTTPVVCRSLSPGETIDQIWARIKTAAVRSAGACALTVGDDDDADGFLVSADAKAAAGTAYGNVPTERGVYLYDSTVKAGYQKAYSAVKSLKIVLSTVPDTQALIQVVIVGHRQIQG